MSQYVIFQSKVFYYIAAFFFYLVIGKIWFLMVNPVLKVYSLSNQGEAALVSVRRTFVASLHVTKVLVVARSFHIHVEQQTDSKKKLDRNGGWIHPDIHDLTRCS